jgi:diguanylate cyclase (GGDEF)-like protein
MRSRYGALAAYSILLSLVAASVLLLSLPGGIAFPRWWVALLGIGACLFVWQFGLRAPRLGLISMERLPQIGMLLVFDPAVAASICGFASLLWPLISKRYSQGSLKVATLRALHNAAMTVLMLMAAGQAYLLCAGRHPLTGLLLADVPPLIAMACAAQLVNVGLMVLFYRFDGRDVRSIVTPSYALSDLIFVPAGILAAVLFNTGNMTVFALFTGLMLLFVLSFNSIGTQREAEADRGPLTRLFEAGRALQGARRIDDLAERTLVETRALFRFHEMHLLLVERERRQLDLRVHERQGVRLPRRQKPIDAGLFGWLVARAEPLLIKDWSLAPPELPQRAEVARDPMASMLAVPLIHDGIVLGLLSVQHAQPGTYAAADLHLLRQLGQQVAVALADARAFEDLENYRRHLEKRVAERTEELEQANAEKERLITMLRERSQKLERETLEDALTGVANRRSFTQRLAAEIDVALAIGRPLSVAIADLDHFKVVNDELGHPVGDQALRQSAALMRRHCRLSDQVARIGGEEFALILPAMTRDDAIAFCETLRSALAGHDWRTIHADLALTVSIGVAQWDGTAELDELVNMADAQLYRAKRAGRNQVA